MARLSTEPGMGRAFAALALMAALVAVGYSTWETRNLRAALERMNEGSEADLTEMMISLARTEGQLARVRETVDLIRGAGAQEAGQGPDGGALAGKLTAALTGAQREVLQQELEKWVRELTDRREKGWAAVQKALKQELDRRDTGADEKRWETLTDLVQENRKSLAAQLRKLERGLSKPSGETEEQQAALTGLEEGLAAVVEAGDRREQAWTQRRQQDDKRWEELFLALQENKEATRQRYAEVAARLDQWRDGSPQPVNNAARQEPAGGRRQGGRTGGGTERERLAEFCAEVPQSELCRDL